MEYHGNYCWLHISIWHARQFQSYYEHQNNTGKSPNQQLNQSGLTLNLWF